MNDIHSASDAQLKQLLENDEEAYKNELNRQHAERQMIEEEEASTETDSSQSDTTAQSPLMA